MASESNYYELLGVDRYANKQAIEEAYRQQVERNHPDNGGNRGVFAMIENAYNVLNNPVSRTAYDDRLDMTPPHGVAIPGGTFDEPTRSFSSTDFDFDAYDDTDYGSHRGYDDYSGRDAPVQGTSAFDDEPAREQPPIFIRDPDADNNTPRFLPKLTSIKHVFWVIVVAYLAFTLATPAPIVPGLSDGDAVLILLWLFLAWWMLSFGLRMIGLVAMIMTTIQWAGGGLLAHDALPRLAAALVVWLTGHWIFTWRHGRWKSVIAHLLLARLPGPIRPDRRQQLGYQL